MLNALWSLLIGLLAMVRTCWHAVRDAFNLQARLSGDTNSAAIWMVPDLDASRLDAVSRSFFWGGTGGSPVGAVADTPPLAVAVLRPAEEPAESIWWLGA